MTARVVITIGPHSVSTCATRLLIRTCVPSVMMEVADGRAELSCVPWVGPSACKRDGLSENIHHGFATARINEIPS